MIGIDNVLTVLESPLVSDELKLIKSCMTFADKNTKSVFASEGFATIKLRAILLQLNRWHDMDILDGIINWEKNILREKGGTKRGVKSRYSLV
jgi:hypothetical protein